MILIDQFPWLRSRWTGYAVAGLSIAIGAVGIYYSSQLLKAPYLIPFIMAVSFAALFGLGPGLAALLLATLASDYFFIPPLGTLGLSRMTWVAAGGYGVVL